MSVRTACTNVIRLEVWVIPQTGLWGFPWGEQAQDQRYVDAHITSDGLPAKDIEASCDAFEQFLVGHTPPRKSYPKGLGISVRYARTTFGSRSLSSIVGASGVS